MQDGNDAVVAHHETRTSRADVAVFMRDLFHRAVWDGGYQVTVPFGHQGLGNESRVVAVICLPVKRHRINNLDKLKTSIFRNRRDIGFEPLIRYRIDIGANYAVGRQYRRIYCLTSKAGSPRGVTSRTGKGHRNRVPHVAADMQLCFYCCCADSKIAATGQNHSGDGIRVVSKFQS